MQVFQVKEVGDKSRRTDVQGWLTGHFLIIPPVGPASGLTRASDSSALVKTYKSHNDRPILD